MVLAATSTGLSRKVWTYDYTRQQLADELDFRVEAVHAKRAQEELDASFCTQCGQTLQECKDTSTITLFVRV